MKTIFTFLILHLVFVYSYSQEKQVNSFPKINMDWELKYNDLYHIEFPKDWTFTIPEQNGVKFLLYSPASSAKDEFGDNFNLVVQNLAGLEMTLEKFIEISKNQVYAYFKNGKIEYSETKEKHRHTFHHIVYTAKEVGTVLRFEQYFWVEEDFAYVLTFTCEKKKYNFFSKISERIFESFRLKI